jgi:hypothetical protein
MARPVFVALDRAEKFKTTFTQRVKNVVLDEPNDAATPGQPPASPVDGGAAAAGPDQP